MIVTYSDIKTQSCCLPPGTWISIVVSDVDGGEHMALCFYGKQMIQSFVQLPIK